MNLMICSILWVIFMTFPNYSNGASGTASWCFRMNEKNKKAPTMSKIQSLTVQSVNECAIKCGRKLPDCRSVSYNEQTNQCILQRTFSDDAAAIPIHAAGFEFLDMKDPIDVCLLEKPCKNSGLCTDDFGFDYNCDCTELYSGKNCSDLTGNVMLVGSYPSNSDIEIYNTEEPAYNKILNKTLNHTRYIYASGVFNNGVVAIASGYKDGALTSDTDLYDTKQEEILSGPKIIQSRSNSASAMLSNQMIVCGGYQPPSILNTCEKLFFNQTNGQFEWVQIASMKNRRQATVMAEVNGKLFTMGGINGVGRLTEAEQYDDTTDTWSDIAEMPTARAFLAATVLNGKIYVCGGQNETTTPINTCEKYDPATNSWTTAITSMKTARIAFSMLTVNGKIYAFGGYSGGSLSSVEVYNPSNDTWTFVEPMKTARDHHMAVLLK